MISRRFFLAAVAVALLSPAFAVAAEAPMAMPMAPVVLGSLEISGAFARATLPGAPAGGAYITVTNKGSTADTLISAKSSVAGKVSLHAMSMEGSVMKMRNLPQGIEIPAGATVTMGPDGLHMMLEHLQHPLVSGATVPVTLTFAEAGSVEVDIPVLGIAAKGPMQGMAM